MAYRDGARVLAATPPVGPHRLRLIEQLLHALAGAGLSRARVVDAAFVMNSYVVGFVLDETLGYPRDTVALKRMRDEGRRWFNGFPGSGPRRWLRSPTTWSMHPRTDALHSASAHCSTGSNWSLRRNENEPSDADLRTLSPVHLFSTLAIAAAGVAPDRLTLESETAIDDARPLGLTRYRRIRRASSTTCTAASAGSPPASPPTPPGARAR